MEENLSAQKNDGNAPIRETPEAPPAVLRSRKFIEEIYPDKKLDNDEEYEGVLYDYLTSAKSKLADNDEANKAIAEILFDYPEFAEIIEDMKNGVPIRIALAKHFDPEDLTVGDDEEDAGRYREAVADRRKRRTESEARIKERDENLKLSEKEFEQFMESSGWDEEKTEAFTEWVQEFINDFARGMIKRPVLVKLKQAFEYEEAVEDARKTGEIDGRNAQIEEKRIKAEKQTDGLPKAGGGGSGTDEQKNKQRKIIDIDALKANNL